MPPAMRHSNHAARFGSPGALALAGLLALLTIACGSTASPSPVTPAPTPVITPDPHLREPVTADEIFKAIGAQSDRALGATNAVTGGPGDPLVKRINADFASWPLIITAFASSSTLRTVTGWDPSVEPVQGDPPYAFVGLNILVEFGPSTGIRLEVPVEARQAQARELAAILDPLLWPLEQRSVDPIETRTPEPEPGASTEPSADASADPSGSASADPSGSASSAP